MISRRDEMKRLQEENPMLWEIRKALLDISVAVEDSCASDELVKAVTNNTIAIHKLRKYFENKDYWRENG